MSMKISTNPSIIDYWIRLYYFENVKYRCDLPEKYALSSRLFLVSTYQHINEKSEILFRASVLQKNVICRVGFLYWKENPLSIRTPSTWDSKPEILHFSRLQFHACFQITLDAQVLTHSAHFCWPSRAASEYRAYKKVLYHFLISAKQPFILQPFF